MIIDHKIGNLFTQAPTGKTVDYIFLEWFETRKRILTKLSQYQRMVSLQFLDKNPELTEGDILWEGESDIIAVGVLPCDCLVIQPADLLETAAICYEIGNKHLPLFYEAGALLVPFEMPLFSILQLQGFSVMREQRKLLRPLKTSVAAHPIPLSIHAISSTKSSMTT